MTDSQRVIRDLLKEVVEAVNRQAGQINDVGVAVVEGSKVVAAQREAVNAQAEFLMAHSDAVLKLGNSIIGLQEVEARRWENYVKQMRYDPSSGCCHGRKR